MQLGQEHLCPDTRCHNDLLVPQKFKSDNELKKVTPLDFSAFMQLSDQSIMVEKVESFDSFSEVDKLSNDQAGHKEAPSLPSRFENVEKETEFYMDKAVMEMELPKMIVCYKEGTYHIIKDICVDEGLHSFDSVFVQNPVSEEKFHTQSQYEIDNFNHKEIPSLKSSHSNEQPASGANSIVTLDLTQDDEDFSCETGKVNSDEVLSAPQQTDRCQFHEDIPHNQIKNAPQYSLAALLDMDRHNTKTTEEMEHAPGANELIPLHKLQRGDCQVDLQLSESSIEQSQLVISDDKKLKSSNDGAEESESNEAGPNPFMSVINSSCLDLPTVSGKTKIFCSEGSNLKQLHEGSLEEVNLTSTGVNHVLIREENVAEDLTNIGSLGGNIVAFDVNFEPLATVPDEDSKEESEIQHSELLKGEGILETTSTDELIVSSRPSFSHGYDTYYHGPASLSGRVAYSGQIPYSGSISLRSDSSTTSTRSFAFPVLQSEWNSSPVRMAKADRRHFRRHRGWRSGLFCCRF